MTSSLLSDKTNSKFGAGIVVLVFLLTRLAFFGFMAQHGSILAPITLEPWTEAGQRSPGLWIDYAQQLEKGDLTVNYDDMGVPKLLLGLHRMGIPYEATFSIFLYLLLALGAVLVLALHRTLAREGGVTAATWIVLGLILYPRGIYFSGQFTIFLLPVYAFLLSILILKNDSTLFQSLTLSRSAILIGSALLLTFFCFARSPCRATVAVLFIGLLIRGAWKPARRKGFLIFSVSFILFFALFKLTTPPSGHTFWHPIYRGLSNFDNRFNIEPSDEGMIALARRQNPSLRADNIWADPNYEATFKKLTLDLVGAHPFWYGRVLAMRTLTLVCLPRSGGWLPRLESSVLNRTFALKDLISGSQLLPVKFYICFYNLSTVADLALILLGFAGLVLSIRGRPFTEILPVGLLLFSVLYIFIPIDSHYRDVYMAGSYFYLYFALQLMGDRFHRLVDSNKTFKRSA